MLICYSGASAPSARRIALEGDDIELVRQSNGDINWGRASAHTSLNPDIHTVTNKRVMRELFREHGVPCPKLYYPSSEESDLFGGGYIPTPCVGRPDKHTGGRGFWLCKTPDDIMRALKGTRRKKAATHFMEYISKERAPREYRVHIFEGKSIRISEKRFGTTGLTAHGSYTTVKPIHNVDHVRKAAKQAVKAVGLDFGAVDILANDSECWVLEVNAAPGLGGSMPRVYAEAFARWYERREYG